VPANKVARYFAEGAEKTEGEAGKEKVIATLTGIDTTPERPVISFEVNAPLSTEAEAEETILRIRRTSVTGAEVKKVAQKIAASAVGELNFSAQDKPGELAGGTYVLTAEQKKATKKDTFIFPTFEATV
jgi:hypothetical protein